jgi:hypothetical protein
MSEKAARGDGNHSLAGSWQRFGGLLLGPEAGSPHQKTGRRAFDILVWRIIRRSGNLEWKFPIGRAGACAEAQYHRGIAQRARKQEYELDPGRDGA